MISCTYFEWALHFLNFWSRWSHIDVFPCLDFFSPFSNIIFRFTIYQLFIPLLLSGNSIACLYEWFVHLLITLRVFPPVGNKTVVFGHVLLFLLRISGRSVFTFLSIFQTFQGLCHLASPPAVGEFQFSVLLNTAVVNLNPCNRYRVVFLCGVMFPGWRKMLDIFLWAYFIFSRIYLVKSLFKSVVCFMLDYLALCYWFVSF